MTEAVAATSAQPHLFGDSEQPLQDHGRDGLSSAGSDVGARESGDDRATRARNSMLWAAYGDALGFISEMVDQRGLERRTLGTPLDHLMGWKRRVGGSWGVDVQLPAGCWSDDTQLRLAVSRSISSRGFDVETFARIELPVWLSYALGGGRASKSAARNLGKTRALWYANTFPRWTNAGGNGAAMRIQPHVWAWPDASGGYMRDVITNSVCTHGHPRAIVGAGFHAATLEHCLNTGKAPDLAQCHHLAAELSKGLHLIEDDSHLGRSWIGRWEQESGDLFSDCWSSTVNELSAAIASCAEVMEVADSFDAVYAGIVNRLGLRVHSQRGSGILTTVAAAALATAAPKAHEGVLAAANAIGTDTDTIATMAGALLGACDGTPDPPEAPLDSNYLQKEAGRLTAISRGEPTGSHQYPDLLTWSAPQTQADALVSDNGSLVVEGLGSASPLDTVLVYTNRQDFAWQWVQTSFDQTLLIKRRPKVKPLEASNNLSPPPAPQSARRTDRKTGGKPAPKPLDRGVDVDKAIAYARTEIADNTALGYTVRRVARDGTIAELAALVTALRDDLRR